MVQSGKCSGREREVSWSNQGDVLVEEGRCSGPIREMF